MSLERIQAIQKQESAYQGWMEESNSFGARLRRCLSDILLYGSIGGAAISFGLSLYNLVKGTETMVNHTGQAPEYFLSTAVGLMITTTIGVFGPMVSQRIGQSTTDELNALQRYIQLIEQPLPNGPSNGSIESGGVPHIVIPPLNPPGTQALQEPMPEKRELVAIH